MFVNLLSNDGSTREIIVKETTTWKLIKKWILEKDVIAFIDVTTMGKKHDRSCWVFRHYWFFCGEAL
jgi:hypothetical protein